MFKVLSIQEYEKFASDDYQKNPDDYTKQAKQGEYLFKDGVYYILDINDISKDSAIRDLMAEFNLSFADAEAMMDKKETN